eukprot:GHVU01003885.1.p1 GENE.GHVU01003885.1~~GHVU01003885.1.p1  ORF type:complete len:227 (+),score=31.22 GHVU01003885.1:512-1192(+)
MDHTNYARWLLVHVRDMVNLKQIHLEIPVEFSKGHFTVQKTTRAFSSIAIDQAHEQNNAAVKREGGAIRLTQNPDALRRWMVAGPELVRITTEFEASSEGRSNKTASETRQHEQTKSSQMKFAEHITALVEVLEEMGNPFQEQSKDLLRIHTRDIVDPTVSLSIQQAEDMGQQQYQKVVKDRLLTRKTPTSEPLKRNRLKLFKWAVLQTIYCLSITWWKQQLVVAC